MSGRYAGSAFKGARTSLRAGTRDGRAAVLLREDSMPTQATEHRVAGTLFIVGLALGITGAVNVTGENRAIAWALMVAGIACVVVAAWLPTRKRPMPPAHVSRARGRSSHSSLPAMSSSTWNRGVPGPVWRTRDMPSCRLVGRSLRHACAYSWIRHRARAVLAGGAGDLDGVGCGPRRVQGQGGRGGFVQLLGRAGLGRPDLRAASGRGDALPASRIIGYWGVALYESVVPGMHKDRSLFGQLNGLPKEPKHWRPHGKIHWPTAANAASAPVPEGLGADRQPGHGRGDRCRWRRRSCLRRRADSHVHPKDQARSVGWGRQVADAILAWAAGDGYSVVNNCPYIPPVGEASGSRRLPPTS